MQQNFSIKKSEDSPFDGYNTTHASQIAGNATVCAFCGESPLIFRYTDWCGRFDHKVFFCNCNESSQSGLDIWDIEKKVRDRRCSDELNHFKVNAMMKGMQQ